MSSLDEGALQEHVAINPAHWNEIAADWVEMGEGAWGADSVAWAWDPCNTAMSRQAKSPRSRLRKPA